MPELELWQWLTGILCAFMIGVAKTGVPGIAAFVIPLMVLTVGDARYAAAWTLPMLSTGDFFAVTYWHRQADIRKLLSLIPWVAVGMAIGGVALAFPEALLRRVIGGIVMSMVVLWIAGSWVARLDVVLVALAGSVVMFLPGVRLLDWPTARAGVAWETLLMIGASPPWAVLPCRRGWPGGWYRRCSAA